MVAGTSSSAILAGFLVRPGDSKNNYSYYARDVVNFFKTRNEDFFESRHLNSGAHWIVTILSAMIGAVAGYRLGVRIYANPPVEQTIVELQCFIKDLKSLKKTR